MEGQPIDPSSQLSPEAARELFTALAVAEGPPKAADAPEAPIESQPLVWAGKARPTNLREVLEGLTCQNRKVEVNPGDVLMAMVGAHPRWTLTAGALAVVKDVLRPLQLEVKPSWELRGHQKDGYNWLMSRAAGQMGALLADSMGLGKTRQAIAYILGIRAGLQASEKGEDSSAPKLKGSWGRALVLAPAMLVRGEDSVWQRELREASAQWQEQLKVWSWHGERAIDLRYEVNTAHWKGPIVELYDVVLTSYESFLLNQDKFLQESWTCVVLDEAQTIKNHASQTSHAVKRLSEVPYRLALTGSPIENSLDDMHSILQFVEPSCVGTLQDFREKFAQNDEGRSSLQKLLQFLMLRRESGEAIQLVAKEEVEVAVKMAEDQAKIYEVLKDGLDSPENSFHKLFRDMELLCSHPWCYLQRNTGEDLTEDALVRRGVRRGKLQLPERFYGEAKDQDINDSGKTAELFAILRGVQARREKVLVFFCRTVTSELLAALMEREFGVRPGILRGDTPHAERERIISHFKADPIPGEPFSQVLLLSVWVGAVGLNLPEARWVIHMERVWNPAMERQATSRAHRLTSRFPVKAYCLFTEDTVEARKCAVLSFKSQLSTNVMEALDADFDEGQDDEKLLKEDRELRQLICGEKSLASDDIAQELDLGQDELEELANEADEGEESEEEDGKGKKKCAPQPLYPSLDRLRPPRMKPGWVGKYGDPRDGELWDWYTVQGRSEVHERAPQFSTGRLAERKVRKDRPRMQLHRPFNSRSCRIRDVKERQDHIASITLSDGVSCRLFIPEHLRELFKEEKGLLQKLPPTEEEAPFTILTPSFSRSALDEEVGLLDLSASMVRDNGQPVKFLHIVAVKASEVEKYRSSAPFFVIMELPTSVTLQHEKYGAKSPEELGVGCARHWLVRLAISLKLQYAFFLDDSVRSWRGVTLVEDQHCLFGSPSGPKAQFKQIPMTRVMEYLAEPEFLAQEMPKFVAFGFARLAPELMLSRRAFCRSHVYSAFLLNLVQVEEQGLNFKQEIFVWEDLVFNLQAHDVVKSNRFAMVKQPFKTGGCSQMVARSANPFIRAHQLSRLSGEQLAAETLGVEAPKVAGKRKRGRKAAAGVQEDEGPKAPFDLLKLEEDPSLQAEGAVVDDNGALVNSYYKRFIQAFKDAEKARADVAAPTGLKRPGVRPGEEIPEHVRFWDDSLGRRKGVVHSRESWGAGYIASPIKAEDKKRQSKWFNVKTWGCWRMAFVLARLQQQVWQKRYDLAVENGEIEGVAPEDKDKEITTPEAKKKESGEAQSGQKKRGRPRSSKSQAAQAAAPAAASSGKGEKKSKRKSSTPPTLENFFSKVRQTPEAPEASEPAPEKKQKTLAAFMSKGASKSSKDKS